MIDADRKRFSKPQSAPAGGGLRESRFAGDPGPLEHETDANRLYNTESPATGRDFQQDLAV